MIENREIITRLICEKKELEQVCQRAEKQLRTAPEGMIRVIKHHGSVQFFLRADEKDRNGEYMPRSQEKLIRALLQKKYDLQLLKKAGAQLKVIDRFLGAYDPEALVKAYERSGRLVKNLLDPVEVSDPDFRYAWESLQYIGKEFREDTPAHFTRRGERVRSKSEVLIADGLDEAGIPYRYECPLKLKDRIIYPDFTILCVRERVEKYWEHYGMMDDSEYRNTAEQKTRNYIEAGIIPGKQLIITSETYRLPLNKNIISQLIKQYF